MRRTSYNANICARRARARAWPFFARRIPCEPTRPHRSHAAGAPPGRQIQAATSARSSRSKGGQHINASKRVEHATRLPQFYYRWQPHSRVLPLHTQRRTRTARHALAARVLSARDWRSHLAAFTLQVAQGRSCSVVCGSPAGARSYQLGSRTISSGRQYGAATRMGSCRPTCPFDVAHRSPRGFVANRSTSRSLGRRQHGCVRHV